MYVRKFRTHRGAKRLHLLQKWRARAFGYIVLGSQRFIRILCRQLPAQQTRKTNQRGHTPDTTDCTSHLSPAHQAELFRSTSICYRYHPKTITHAIYVGTVAANSFFEKDPVTSPWHKRALTAQSESNPAAGERLLRPRSAISGLRWWILALIFLVTCINYIDRSSVGLLVTHFGPEIGISSSQYGLIGALLLLAYTVSQSISGRLYDRYGARLGFTVSIIV